MYSCDSFDRMEMISKEFVVESSSMLKSTLTVIETAGNSPRINGGHKAL